MPGCGAADRRRPVAGHDQGGSGNRRRPPSRVLRGRGRAPAPPQATFDLVVSTTSFDHWADQRAGIAECARVLVPGGHLVLVDQFSLLAAFGRPGKARTKRRATRLVLGAGFGTPAWHQVYAGTINVEPRIPGAG